MTNAHTPARSIRRKLPVGALMGLDATAPTGHWLLRWRSPVMLAVVALVSACATAPLPVAAPDSAGPSPATAVVAAPATPARVAAPVAAAATVKPDLAAEGPELLTVDPLDPTVRVDLSKPSARTDLWARVRNGFGLPNLDDTQVRNWEQWYAARPDYVQRMTERGGRYMFHIVEELQRRGMPTELALLPFIESAYNPQAMSSAKASGMWQFIPGTGRDFDLKQNIFRDDRRDVLASTRAALDYLQSLHEMFGDWHLALAAYNWGQGNVKRAIDRNTQQGLPTDYSSLRMPDETRNYVPKLQAVKNIVRQPEAFSLALAPLKNHPYFISVAIDRDIDLDRAARLAELPLDEFKALNPQMNKPVILAAGTPQVLLPYDNANTFVRALQHHRGQLATWTAWVAPKTMKPAQVAELVGMPLDDLRRVNNIPPRMLVKAGSTLLVPRSGKGLADVDEAVADNATLALAPDVPPMRRLSFKAGRKGETVAAAARRYRVSPLQLAAWNNTSAKAAFKPGQTIVVMRPYSATQAKASAGSSKTRVAASSSRQLVGKASVKPVARTTTARASGGTKLAKPRDVARSRSRTTRP